MKRALLLIALLCAGTAFGASPAQVIRYGKFGKVVLLRPAGMPKSVVLFLSGDAGWSEASLQLAQPLVERGALVVGIDTPHYLALLARRDDGCNYMAWDLEDLAHRVEKEIGFQQYVTPILIGQGSGAATSYATLVQSSVGMFAGAVSLDFCPAQSFGGAPLCPGPAAGLRSYRTSGGALLLDPAPVLKDRWIALQPKQDMNCAGRDMDAFASRVGNSQLVRLKDARDAGPQLVAAYDQLVAAAASRRLATSSASSIDVDDLPLIELPTAVHSRRIALLITGDGGWAELDKEVAAALEARGIPVVGLNALKYFWGERTKEATAADVARILRHYLASWKASEILLIGYSFGADVLPFIINRLPADLRARLVSATLLSLSDVASFEVHVAGWMGKTASDGVATRPEIELIKDLPILCLYGANDDEAACDQVKTPNFTAQAVGEGHHFSRLYTQLADSLLAFSAR